MVLKTEATYLGAKNRVFRPAAVLSFRPIFPRPVNTLAALAMTFASSILISP